MSGLDGATVDEFTAGINTPANGQQGYVAFADAQVPYPNLEYKSPAETADALRVAIGQAASSKSAEPSTIGANGTHSVTLAVPNTPYTVYVYLLRAQVRVGSTMNWYGQRRLVILTGSTGAITGSDNVSEVNAGSGFTLAAGASGNTVTCQVTSTVGTPGTVFASITEIYRKTTPTP
jgi:hypothetical protein